eukprot:Pompholyxophrys_punicea_v1_NODE_413_length_2024_cov_2.684611.p2 type:complete len:161 gc:universal NODE_413_length_2024_cov_2.684611:213-695(+)
MASSRRVTACTTVNRSKSSPFPLIGIGGGDRMMAWESRTPHSLKGIEKSVFVLSSELCARFGASCKVSEAQGEKEIKQRRLSFWSLLVKILDLKSLGANLSATRPISSWSYLIFVCFQFCCAVARACMPESCRRLFLKESSVSLLIRTASAKHCAPLSPI